MSDQTCEHGYTIDPCHCPHGCGMGDQRHSQEPFDRVVTMHAIRMLVERERAEAFEDDDVENEVDMRHALALLDSLASLDPEAVREVVEAAQRRRAEGHDRHCQARTMPSTPCVCGHARLDTALSRLKEKS